MAKKFKVDLLDHSGKETIRYTNPLKDNSNEALSKMYKDCVKALSAYEEKFLVIENLLIDRRSFSSIAVSIVDENNKYVSV